MTFKRIWQPTAACFLVFFTLLHHQTVAMQIVATVAQGSTKEPQRNDQGRGQNERWTALTLSVLGDWGYKNMSLTPTCYVHVYTYIYIKKKNASFGSNEMLKNKERPWTMFQWHTCPSNRVMRQNRTMWQTQKKPTIGDDFYHLLYLYSYWGWFIAGFTTVPHYFQHTHTYIYNIFCNIYITIIYYHLPWFSIPPPINSLWVVENLPFFTWGPAPPAGKLPKDGLRR